MTSEIPNHPATSDAVLDLAVHADRAETILASLADHLIDSSNDTLDFGSLKPRHVAAESELTTFASSSKTWPDPAPGLFEQVRHSTYRGQN
jgi:hypothetical protein